MLWIDVESASGDMGEVVNVNDGAAYLDVYKDKAVDFRDNKKGMQFNCADPLNNFKVFESRWYISHVEKLKENPYAAVASVADSQQ